MDSLPSLQLRPGEGDRIVAGHPWIYAGAFQRIDSPPADGAVVAIKDHRQRFLGVGFFNSHSKILVRLLSTQADVPDAAFFERRMQDALAVRRRHMPTATSFRLVNAESDFLSGLVVDKYEDVLVVQTSSFGMDQRKPAILAALQSLLAPRAIAERNDAAFRKFEGLENANGMLAGQVDGPVPVRLNGIEFEADLVAGHKTGLYLDQQVNYQRVADLIALGPRNDVLDAFCFQGGFSLHAARAGAARVVGLDQSAEATGVAQKLAARNGLAEKCAFEATNVFDWLKARTARPAEGRVQPCFDAVILDPPSFTRTRANVPDALRGYKEIHLRALKLIRPGGLLATFCCSHHVDGRTFLDVILSAAFDARRVLRRVAVLSQSPDHPVIPSIPETEYLKGYAFEVVR
jgi:23S rRNA (cytosine1962-C5)-methyltransferase